MVKKIIIMLVLTACASAYSFDQKKPSYSLDKKTHGSFQPLKDLFKQADKDKDGAISLLEHEDFVAMQSERGRERFKELDADGDNIVTASEAHAFAVKKLKQRSEIAKEKMDKRIRRLENWDGEKQQKFEEFRQMKMDKQQRTPEFNQ